jgi:transcriptional regulator with XRE-family HTH domain
MPPKITRKSIGRQLEQERLRRGLALRDVALLAGVSHQTVRAFELGRGKHIDILDRLARKLGFRLRLELIDD